MVIWNILLVIGIIILVLAAAVRIIEIKVIHDIRTSTDVEDLIKIYDAKDTVKRKETAEKRLIEIAKTTTDPDVFVIIANKFDIENSFRVNLEERFSHEDILLRIRSKTYIPASACESAIEQIQDEKTLAEAYEKIEYSEETRSKILEKITDRDIIYSLALNNPDQKDVVSRLEEEQLSRFGMDCCRNGHHDWELIEDRDTTNEELDIRGYYEVYRCRRCRRTESERYDDARGTKKKVIDPGLFNA